MPNTIKDVQRKILQIMLFIDKLCIENDIKYMIMGGTALGAVRHGGFIPWDDDLDIFMTPDNYYRFKKVFEEIDQDQYIIQEWKTTAEYIEYAKVRMNGTTFIEESFKNRKDIHQGIYVDIMLLHKIPDNYFLQRLVYFESKFVTLYALSQRNWTPKTGLQKVVMKSLSILPCHYLAKKCYKRIYKYDSMKTNYKYCYWITPAKFKSGLFDADFFDELETFYFEGHPLLGPKKIKEYLSHRYGDYMKLPNEEKRKAAVHAYIWDCDENYTKYIGE